MKSPGNPSHLFIILVLGLILPWLPVKSSQRVLASSTGSSRQASACPCDSTVDPYLEAGNCCSSADSAVSMLAFVGTDINPTAVPTEDPAVVDLSKFDAQKAAMNRLGFTVILVVVLLLYAAGIVVFTAPRSATKTAPDRFGEHKRL